jgi:hypothetical protein
MLYKNNETRNFGSKRHAVYVEAVSEYRIYVGLLKCGHLENDESDARIHIINYRRMVCEDGRWVHLAQLLF